MNARDKRPSTESPDAEIGRCHEQLATLRRRQVLLEAVILAAGHLIKTDDLGQGMVKFLAQLGQATEADRVYILETRARVAQGPSVRLRHAWAAPGAELHEDGLAFSALAKTSFPNWIEKLTANQAIYSRLRDLPGDTQRIMSAQNIRSLVVVPIFVENDWWGSINIDYCRVERDWSLVELDALKMAAGIVGAALRHQQMEEARREADESIRSRAQQLAALHDISRTIGSTLDVDKMLHLTLERSCELFQAPMGTAHLADLIADVAVQRAVVGLSQAEATRTAKVPLEASLIGQVIITGRPVFIERRARSAMSVGAGIATEAAAFIPLVIGEHVLGTLNLIFDAPRIFGDEDRTLLTSIGRQVGMALANARLFQEILAAEKETRRLFAAEQKARQMAEALQESARIVNASLDLDQALNLLLEQLTRLIPYDSAAVFLSKGEQLYVAAGRGFPDMNAVMRLTVRAEDNALLRQAIDTGRPVCLSDAQEDQRFQGWANTDYVRSWIGAPLIVGTELVGVMTVDSRQPGAYDQESTRLVQALADQTAVAIHKARLLGDLKRANRALRRLDELKDQFIQNVAHELRTPLTLVRGNLELLSWGGLDLETQQQAILTATAHADNLVRLVEGITTLQDLTIKGSTPQPMNLAELAETALQLARQEALQVGIELRTDYPPDLPIWPGDSIRLLQALYQLLDNAIKFSPNGGTVTLRLRHKQDRNELQIEVEDQGIGVPLEEQQSIFDLFYQADGTTTRRFGGAGLGLAIVQRIVQAHGGRVWVESPLNQADVAPGPGSKFIVRLPLTTE